MSFQLTAADERRLVGVAAPLVAVVRRAALLSPQRFMVVEGLRTKERQRKLVKEGASQTMNSKHLVGRAVDLAPVRRDGSVSWDWKDYHPLAKHVKRAAADLDTRVVWGGDWKSFKDGPHWELADGE